MGLTASKMLFEIMKITFRIKSTAENLKYNDSVRLYIDAAVFISVIGHVQIQRFSLNPVSSPAVNLSSLQYLLSAFQRKETE